MAVIVKLDGDVLQWRNMAGWVSESARRSLSLLAVAVLLPSALAAEAPWALVGPEVSADERVASEACGFLHVRCRERLATHGVLAVRDGFEMPRIEAPPVSAQMVQYQPLGYWPPHRNKRAPMPDHRRRTTVGPRGTHTKVSVLVNESMPRPTLVPLRGVSGELADMQHERLSRVSAPFHA